MRKVASLLLFVCLFCCVFSAFAKDFEIIGDTVTAYKGETVDYSLSVNGNPGAVAFRIELGWDKETFTLVPGSVVYSDGFTGGTSIENEKIQGKLYSAWINTENVCTDGQFFNLKFSVSDKAKTGDYRIKAVITAFTDVNGVKYQPTVKGGTIKVKSKHSSGSSSQLVIPTIGETSSRDDDVVQDNKDSLSESSESEKAQHSENPFVDVTESAYYYDAVMWAVDNKITSGITEKAFEPETKCTRAQAVTFLYRFSDIKSDESEGGTAFKDVDKSAYYYLPVIWAVRNSITSGTDTYSFSPDNYITRGQLVTFLWRLAGKPEVTTAVPFSDVKSDSYYFNAVAWAVENNITSGMTDTEFCPDEFCTRGQIVTFMKRYAGILQSQN